MRLKGPPGTKNASVKGTRILPGKSVALGLLSASGLRAGSYTATVTLKQGTLRRRSPRRSGCAAERLAALLDAAPVDGRRVRAVVREGSRARRPPRPWRAPA